MYLSVLSIHLWFCLVLNHHPTVTTILIVYRIVIILIILTITISPVVNLIFVSGMKVGSSGKYADDTFRESILATDTASRGQYFGKGSVWEAAKRVESYNDLVLSLRQWEMT